MKLWIGIAVAVVALAVAAFAIAGNPFGQSMSEQVSDEVGADARCRKAGLEVIAGERERVYTCSYHGEVTRKGRTVKRYYQVCVAIVDGDLYIRPSC